MYWTAIRPAPSSPGCHAGPSPCRRSRRTALLQAGLREVQRPRCLELSPCRGHAGCCGNLQPGVHPKGQMKASSIGRSGLALYTPRCSWRRDPYLEEEKTVERKREETRNSRCSQHGQLYSREKSTGKVVMGENISLSKFSLNLMETKKILNIISPII